MSFKCTQIFSCLFFVLVLLFTPALLHAGDETVIHGFAYTDGANPISGLASDGTGNYFGVTPGGGLGPGIVYELSPNGNGAWKQTVLYSFTGGVDGSEPSHVIFDGGVLYGITQNGGTYGLGTLFELVPSGTGWTEAVLYSFPGGPSGHYPQNGPIRDQEGNFYVTTSQAVFELSQSSGAWASTQLLSRPINDSIVAGLTMDSAGNIFGASLNGVFELSKDSAGRWLAHILHTFGGTGDGMAVEGTPVLDQAGNLYGTATYGGAMNHGIVFELSPGTTSGQPWTENILYSFMGRKGGYFPLGIVLDNAGNIYGTTSDGGGWNRGTAYELLAPSQSGGSYTFRSLWLFDGPDGNSPNDGLILDGAGHLYGTTYRGGSLKGVCSGTLGCGVVFKIVP